MVILALLTGVIYAVLSWSDRAPQIFSDEAANLGNARWLAGGTRWPMGAASGAGIGYPLMLAPVFWAFDSPASIYRLVVLLNVVLAAVMTVVCYAVARRGAAAGHRGSLAAAACAAAYPAVAVQVGIAWVEVTAMLAVSLLVLTVVCAAERLTPALLLSHGALAGALVGLHGRFVVVPILAVAGLLTVAALRPRLRWWAIGSAVIAVAMDIGAGHLAGLAQRARWAYVALPDVSLGQLLRLSPASVIRSLAGQGWYLIAGTGGLIVVGLVCLARATRRPSSVAAVDSRAAPAPGRGIGGRPLAIYVGLIIASVFAISVVDLAIGLGSNPSNYREDFLYYGRYSEPFVPVLLCLGVAALSVRATVGFVVSTIGTALILSPVLLVIASSLRGSLQFNGTVSPFMVTAVSPYFGLDKYNLVSTRNFIVPAAIATAIFAAVLAIVTLTKRALVPVLVVVVFATVGVLDVRHLAAYNNRLAAQIPMYQALAQRHPRVVAFDPATVGVYLQYALPFWLDRSTFVSFDAAGGKWPDADLFIGPSKWPQAATHGLRRLTIDTVTGRGLYVRTT